MIEGRARRLEFGALRDAIERGDAEGLTGFYAEDAELRVVHAALPEGQAFELEGRARIGRYLKAVCDQEITCSVENGAVVGEGSIEFFQTCEYPKGPPTSVWTTLEVSRGLIVRQTDVVERASSDDRGDEESER